MSLANTKRRPEAVPRYPHVVIKSVRAEWMLKTSGGLVSPTPKKHAWGAGGQISRSVRWMFATPTGDHYNVCYCIFTHIIMCTAAITRPLCTVQCFTERPEQNRKTVSLGFLAFIYNIPVACDCSPFANKEHGSVL